VVLSALSDAEPKGQTHLRQVTAELTAHLKRRSLLVLLSDLLDEDGALAKALHYLHRRGHDVLVFQLLDPDELQLPFTLPTTFMDMEQPHQVPTDPVAVRTAYRRQVDAFVQACRTACGQANAHYILLPTDTDLPTALGHYLAWRARRRR
jgi:uncharacterized protein (DUF58 family)